MIPARPHRGGFTIIELLIVMTVVGILAVVLLLRVQSANQEAFRASVLADLRSVSVAQELYFFSHMSYAELDDLETFTPTVGVHIDITHASPLGFAMTATHNGLPETTCGHYFGEVPPGSALPAEQPGRTVCD